MPAEDWVGRDPVLPAKATGTVHEIAMSAEETQIEVSPGVTQLMWTFDGQVPGPILHDAFKEALYDPAHLATIARFDMPVRYLGTEDYATAAMMQNEEEKRTVQELGLRAS